jgi:hypothetical protein
MSYVIAAPEMMAAAATDLATIGSMLSAAHTTAAPTVAVVPAAADEVSASIAHLFSQHAADYQAMAAQAAAFHEQFVQDLTAGAGSYASAEAANTSALDPFTGGKSALDLIKDNVDTIAGELTQHTVGQTGKAIQDALIRYNEKATEQMKKLQEIEQMIKDAGKQQLDDTFGL